MEKQDCNETSPYNINCVIKIRSIINILKNIKNDIFAEFSNIYNYEEDKDKNKEKEKLYIKLTNNINIIDKLITHNIIYDNEIINSIYNSLVNTYSNTSETKQNYLLFYRKIKKALGHIIFDMYRYSGYHVILSNMPMKAIAIANNKSEDIDNFDPVDSEVIYDTIEHYIGSYTVDKILQVTEKIYLAKMKNIYDSKKVCELLNKMQISENIIKVELLITLAEYVETVVEESPIEPVVEPVQKPQIESLIESVNDEYEELELINSTDMLKSVSESENENENENSENIKNIEIKNVPSDNLLVVDIAYSIYNKISNVFSYFRR